MYMNVLQAGGQMHGQAVGSEKHRVASSASILTSGSTCICCATTKEKGIAHLLAGLAALLWRAHL